MTLLDHPLATARALRTLQLVTIALSVAGNLSYSTLVYFDVVAADFWFALPFAFLSAILFAVLCVRVQRAAHALGGLPPSSETVTASLFCALLGFVGIPLTLHKTASAVAIALNDDVVRQRGVALAWTIGLSPVPLAFASAITGLHLVAPLASVVLLGIATQLIAAPLVEEFRARAPQGGVDGDGTSAAIRSL